MLPQKGPAAPVRMAGQELAGKAWRRRKAQAHWSSGVTKVARRWKPCCAMRSGQLPGPSKSPWCLRNMRSVSIHAKASWEDADSQVTHQNVSQHSSTSGLTTTTKKNNSKKLKNKCCQQKRVFPVPVLNLLGNLWARGRTRRSRGCRGKQWEQS